MDAKALAEKIDSRLNLVSNLSDKDIFIAASSTIKSLLLEIEDLEVDNRGLQDEVRDLEYEHIARELQDFDMTEIIEHVKSDGTVISDTLEFVRELRQTIDQGDKTHLEILLGRLENIAFLCEKSNDSPTAYFNI
jgi:FtsZ-binding cell division protein ZapB